MFSERSAPDELDSDSAALAAALAGLVPQHSVDRDRVMFLAGQASVMPRESVAPLKAVAPPEAVGPRRLARRVPTAAAMLAASLAGLIAGWQLHAPAAPQIATRAPQERQPATEPLDSRAAAPVASVESRAVAPMQPGWTSDADHASLGADYVNLRRRVLSNGVGALSPAYDGGPRDAGEDRSYWQMRGQLFNRDVLPATDRRSLDSILPSPAGARI